MGARVRPDPRGLPPVVSRTQALKAGLSPGRIDYLVASGRWRVLTRGRYLRAWEVPGDVDRFAAERRVHSQLATAAAQARAQGVVGYASAAILHGLPLVSGVPNKVHVLVPPGGWTGIRGPVRSREARLSPEDVTVVEIQGIGPVAVTSVARTWLDVARTMSLGDALSTGDRALRLGLVRPDDLRVVRARVGRLRGLRRAGLALEHLDARRESPLESGSAAHFITWQWPAPRLQSVFHDQWGFVARTDFDWPECGVVGEADGLLKYDQGIHVERSEKVRENRLRALGQLVVRWGWRDMVGDGDLLWRLLAPYLGVTSFPPRDRYARPDWRAFESGEA